MRQTLTAVVSKKRSGNARPALYVGLSGVHPRATGGRIGLHVDQVVIGRGERNVTRTEINGVRVLTLTLPDPHLSGQHARMARIAGNWLIADLDSKNGTWVDRERIKEHELRDGDSIVIGHTALVFRDRGGEAIDTFDLPTARDPGLRTYSVDSIEMFNDLAAAARSTVPIELSGESGTGKELAARAVHALSGRPGRFVAVNCGSLSSTLLEAELFGHKKGAYTGATEDRLGLVRGADGGTLFLDEIAELPLQSQAALLRVLQEGEVMPVGGDRPIKVDLRIVTATLKNLGEEVEAKRFREDLRARLMGVRVTLPPLRQRREDLGWLIATLLDRVAQNRELEVSADAVAALYAYDWPLNIRELERALTAAVALADNLVELRHLPAEVQEMPERELQSPDELTREETDVRARIVASVERHDGNLSAVARELGKDRKQIQRWVKRFRIER